MDYSKCIASNQKEESISIERVTSFLPTVDSIYSFSSLEIRGLTAGVWCMRSVQNKNQIQAIPPETQIKPMKKVNKQCLLDTPRTVRVSEKTWQVIVRTRRP